MTPSRLHFTAHLKLTIKYSVRPGGRFHSKTAFVAASPKGHFRSPLYYYRFLMEGKLVKRMHYYAAELLKIFAYLLLSERETFFVGKAARVPSSMAA